MAISTWTIWRTSRIPRAGHWKRMSWTKSKWINSKICCYLSPWDISDPRSYEHYWTSSWNESWKKIQAHTRFEPMTSTNWANKPTGSWSQCWIQINFPSGEQWVENYTGSNWWNLKQASNLINVLKIFCQNKGPPNPTPDLNIPLTKG